MSDNRRKYGRGNGGGTEYYNQRRFSLGTVLMLLCAALREENEVPRESQHLGENV